MTKRPNFIDAACHVTVDRPSFTQQQKEWIEMNTGIFIGYMLTNESVRREESDGMDKALLVGARKFLWRIFGE